MLLCENKFRDVWSRNESVRAEIGQILRAHTHAAKLVVEIRDCVSLVVLVVQCFECLFKTWATLKILHSVHVILIIFINKCDNILHEEGVCF